MNAKALLMPQFYMKYAKRRIIPGANGYYSMYADGEREMRVVVDYPAEQRGVKVRVVGFLHTVGMLFVGN